MATSVEILISGDESVIGREVVKEATVAARELGLSVCVTTFFRGGSDWLCLWGVGHKDRDAARVKQISAGWRTACWDLGYIKAGKIPRESYLRVSVDYNHPWRMFDQTPTDLSRLLCLGVLLREDFDQGGPVILIGIGPKSRSHLGLNDRESKKLIELKDRFPNRQILYRPKPFFKRGKYINRDKHIMWPLTGEGPIEEVLYGASLVVCRHSNVAVDACVAGVPVECEDGAAFWLYRNGTSPNVKQRIDFLGRLAWWQYRTDEQVGAWKFLQTVCA